MRAAQQSFDQAGMTNVDQLSQDYYNKLAALSAPEQQRQRLATEERLRAQGRLGVSGSAYGGTSPELLAQEQAIAQQQLQRELQSRQAALGERGTLLSQGTAALQPATQLGQFGLNTAQQQFANDLLRQQYLTGLKSQGVQGEIALRSRAGDLAARGIESAGVLQRQGLQDLLARQLQATWDGKKWVETAYTIDTKPQVSAPTHQLQVGLPTFGDENTDIQQLANIPVLKYLKDPVVSLSELYSRYKEGGEYGWYAFVFIEKTFAWWNSDKERWELLTKSGEPSDPEDRILTSEEELSITTTGVIIVTGKQIGRA